MKSLARFIALMLLSLAATQILWGVNTAGSSKWSAAGKAQAEEAWQKAIGKWRNQAGTLLFELVDMNKADREYHPSEPAKVEGYIRKVPLTWSTKIHADDLVFISQKVEGNTLSGQWIQAPQKGDCPKMPVDYSSCLLKIDAAGETLTSKVETKQYWHPKCEWSDKVVTETFTYYRVKSNK